MKHKSPQNTHLFAFFATNIKMENTYDIKALHVSLGFSACQNYPGFLKNEGTLLFPETSYHSVSRGAQNIPLHHKEIRKNRVY